MILAFVFCLEELSNCCKYFVLNSDKWSNILHHHSLTHCTVRSEGVTSSFLSLGNSYNQRHNLYQEKFCLTHFSFPFKCHFILLGVHSPILPSPLSTKKNCLQHIYWEKFIHYIKNLLNVFKKGYESTQVLSYCCVSRSVNKYENWFMIQNFACGNLTRMGV